MKKQETVESLAWALEQEALQENAVSASNQVNWFEMAKAITRSNAP